MKRYITLCMAILALMCVFFTFGCSAENPKEESEEASATDVTPTDVLYIPDVHIDGIVLPEEYGEGLYDSAAALWLINEVRDREGLPPFVIGDEKLEDAAVTRLKEIASDFSHTRPDARDNKPVFEENEIKYASCGENLASGQYTAEHVVYDWLHSESHKAILFDEKFTYVSIVCGKDAEGIGYWVLLAYEPMQSE